VHAASDKPAIKGDPPGNKGTATSSRFINATGKHIRKRNSKYDDKVGAEPGSRFIAL
jgi:hypothetical protein